LRPGETAEKGGSDGPPSDALNRLIQADESDLPHDLREALAASLREGTPKDVNEALCVAQLGNKITKPINQEDTTITRRASKALRVQLQVLLQSSVLARSKVGRHGRLDAR